jgi:hypothetical protein
MLVVCILFLLLNELLLQPGLGLRQFALLPLLLKLPALGEGERALLPPPHLFLLPLELLLGKAILAGDVILLEVEPLEGPLVELPVQPQSQETYQRNHTQQTLDPYDRVDHELLRKDKELFRYQEPREGQTARLREDQQHVLGLQEVGPHCDEVEGVGQLHASHDLEAATEVDEADEQHRQQQLVHHEHAHALAEEAGLLVVAALPAEEQLGRQIAHDVVEHQQRDQEGGTGERVLDLVLGLGGAEDGEGEEEAGVGRQDEGAV